MNVFHTARQRVRQANATQPAPRIALGHILAGLFLSILATVVFVRVFDFVEDRGGGAGSTAFDRGIEVWVHDWQVGHPGLAGHLLKLAEFLALMGSPRVIVSTAVVAALVGLVWRKVRGVAWTLPIAVIGSGVIIQGVKLFLRRPRPSSFTPLLHESGYSFPSGHSLIAMVVYGLIGYFLSHLVHGKATRWAIRALTGLLVVSIGLSRVYVGVHYPTDVLAGWAAGVPWLIVCLALHDALARRWPSSGEPIFQDRGRPEEEAPGAA